MIKISSEIDVITNSSTEVFCYKKNSQEFKDLCEYLGPELSKEFETYDSLEDIWKEIEKGEYYGPLMHSDTEQGRTGNSDWDGPEVDPFSYDNYELNGVINNMIEKGIKTKREIFDFFASVYEGALDVAYYSWDTDCGRSEVSEKIHGYYQKKQDDAYRKVIKNFKPGDILYSKTKNRYDKNLYPKDEIEYLTLVSEISLDDPTVTPGAVYSDFYKLWDTLYDVTEERKSELGFSNGIHYRYESLYMLFDDIKDIRLATEDEKKIFMKAIEDGGFEISENFIVTKK